MYSQLLKWEVADNYDAFDYLVAVFVYIVLAANETTYKTSFIDSIIVGKKVTWFTLKSAFGLITPK